MSETGRDAEATRWRLPLFPLGSVLFPGMVVPLRAFEERYRALVAHLVRQPDPTQRLFGSVAIREGYEVGEHGQQELYRVGCRLQLTEVAQRADGSYDLMATVRDRIRLLEINPAGAFPIGLVEPVTDTDGTAPALLLEETLERLATYRLLMAGLRGDPLPDPLPRDPEYLVWTFAAASPVTLPDRQQLLETVVLAERLRQMKALVSTEAALMAALPSLPATDLARTAWSPN